MVRRTRTYADSEGTDYGKIKYRHYEPVRHSGAEDPFYALTMASAQKRLAWVCWQEQQISPGGMRIVRVTLGIRGTP